LEHFDARSDGRSVGGGEAILGDDRILKHTAAFLVGLETQQQRSLITLVMGHMVVEHVASVITREP
jgi:hypothetical protein